MGKSQRVLPFLLLGIVSVGALGAVLLGVHSRHVHPSFSITAAADTPRARRVAPPVVSERRAMRSAESIVESEATYDGCCGYNLPRQLGERYDGGPAYLLADPTAEPALSWSQALARSVDTSSTKSEYGQPDLAELREMVNLNQKKPRPTPTLVWLFIWHDTIQPNFGPSGGPDFPGSDTSIAVNASSAQAYGMSMIGGSEGLGEWQPYPG